MAQHTPEVTMPRKRKGSVIWTVVMVIALIVFVCSVGALAYMGYGYLHQGQLHNQLEEEVFTPSEDPFEPPSVNWDALLKKNADTVAWLDYSDMKINFPVVQGKDNEYYLHTTFEGETNYYSSFGAIFLDYRNKSDFSDQLNFIYGHHMNDGSMFSPLEDLTKQKVYDNHRDVTLLTPKETLQLKIFAVCRVDAFEKIVKQNFASEKKLNKYVQEMIERSEISSTFKKKLGKDDRIFAFSTCESNNDNGRIVVFSYVASSKKME